MKKREERFRNKVTIVTGGASGIARATSYILASEGAKVVIAETLKELIKSPMKSKLQEVKH